MSWILRLRKRDEMKKPCFYVGGQQDDIDSRKIERTIDCSISNDYIKKTLKERISLQRVKNIEDLRKIFVKKKFVLVVMHTKSQRS